MITATEFVTLFTWSLFSDAPRIPLKLPCSQSRHTVCRLVATSVNRWEYKLYLSDLEIVKWWVVGMICRHTFNVPNDVIFCRILYSDSTYFQACHWRWSIPLGMSLVFQDLLCTLSGILNLITITRREPLYPASEVTGIPKTSRNALPWSVTLITFTHPCLHSISSKTPLEAPSDWITFADNIAYKGGQYFDYKHMF